MGFLSGGPYYHLTGRTGNNVGRVVRGKNVFSMRPAKSSTPPTVLQLNQQNKWRLVVQWLRRLGGILNVGFASYDSEMSPRNAALSYNLANAVTGVAPNYAIDYGKVVFSRGVLDLPESIAVSAAAGAKLDFSWAAPIGDSNALGTDKATFLVYNPIRDKFVTLKGVILRSALTYSMQLPPDFTGNAVECWLSFGSEDAKLISDSFYVGQVSVI